MINFPNISRPSYPLGISLENNSLTSKFEDGTVQSRAKFTRNRRTFKVSWKSLPNDEYLILERFIKNTVKYSAETFLWVNPATYNNVEQETLEVRIISVDEAEMNTMNFWNVKMTLQEV